MEKWRMEKYGGNVLKDKSYNFAVRCEKIIQIFSDLTKRICSFETNFTFSKFYL